MNWIGKVISKVRIEKMIARGGMAEVYYGMHTTLNRPVAVKVMLSHLEDDSDLRERFEREARVLANLRHPNIIHIYDFDLLDDQPYFVMEYINGTTLSASLRSFHQAGKRLSLPQIGRLMLMLSSALDYAHTQRVIHRDIKPGNILLTAKSIPEIPDGVMPEDVEAILTDFGLLRLTDSSSHSISGTISGTPSYMSPEQARGERADHRTDLYSLGIVLYEMLAGRVPFEADTSMGVILKHIGETPAPIPELPVPLQNVINRALAKNLDDRYNSAGELVRAFLDAADLKAAEIAPGYNVTPIPQPAQSNVTRLQQAQSQPNAAAAILKTKSSKFLPWLIGIPTAIIIFGGMLFYETSAFPALPGASTQTSLSAPTLPANPTITPPPGPLTPAITPTQSGHTAQPALKSVGLLRFFSVSGIFDEAVLSASDLDPLPDTAQYEAWLVGKEARRSLGLLKPDTTGKVELSFVDEQGRNLLAKYDQLEITLEQNPDASPNPSGNVVYSSGIPPMALDHIRHLVVAFADTPNNIGQVNGLIGNTELINASAAAMLAAFEKQDNAAVLNNAEALNNLLLGKQGQNYGDLDGDGEITDPGDGYGLLLNGENLGYIAGTIQHSQLSMQMPDATTNIQIHAEHVIASAENLETWATELLDLLAKISANPLGPEANTQVRQAAALADRMLNGRDLNGNEQIEPVAGEGGAKTALQHAGYLTDMPILPGANMLPQPVAQGSSPGTHPTTSYDQ